jgi:hypothetical protein
LIETQAPHPIRYPDASRPLPGDPAAKNLRLKNLRHCKVLGRRHSGKDCPPMKNQP